MKKSSNNLSSKSEHNHGYNHKRGKEITSNINRKENELYMARIDERQNQRAKDRVIDRANAII